MQVEFQNGRCTLHIDRVTTEDEAEYMCEAKNIHGVVTTIAELLVESKPSLAKPGHHLVMHGCRNLCERVANTCHHHTMHGSPIVAPSA